MTKISEKERKEKLLTITMELLNEYTIEELANWLGEFQKGLIRIAQEGGHE